MQTKQREKQDSLNSVILSNSMAGIENELRINEAEQRASRNKLLALGAATMFLLLLIVALAYIVWSRRRHIRQLRSAYEHALESDRMKTAFMRNVSHEVRTPLNIISGFAQVIADPNLDYSPEERRRMALMMRKNTNAITRLVDEMLELSHSESVGGVEKADNVKVNVLLRELVEEARENVADEVVVSLDSSLADDFIFKTNRQMMRRVVDVLLSNALKFTEKGSVVVSASLVGEQQLLLAVTDTGCGIPASEAEHIFERFVKLDSFKVGIGLGLTLCRASVEKLGGSISLDTSYTGGARFVVTLPRQAE
jgi:signal transduction histidine kinase